MSKFKKKGDGEMPAISTASLPDIVFMLLFFFMVATVMRDNEVFVEQSLPTATQTEKLEKKDRIIYIYAGKPSERYAQTYGTNAALQLGDKISPVSDVQRYILEERTKVNEELIPYLQTSLKVDKNTNVGLISDVKQELREVNALKVNYTTREGKSDDL